MMETVESYALTFIAATALAGAVAAVIASHLTRRFEGARASVFKANLKLFGVVALPASLAFLPSETIDSLAMWYVMAAGVFAWPLLALALAILNLLVVLRIRDRAASRSAASWNTHERDRS